MRKTVLAVLLYVFALEGAGAAIISNPDNYKRDDGGVDVYLRGLYMKTEVENQVMEDYLGGYPDGDTLGASAVGAIVDYRSPYWSGVGVDASAYGVAKIDSEESSRSILKRTRHGNEGFAVLGQVYAKFRHAGDGWYIDGQAGRGRLDAGMVITRSTRVLPSSYQGARGHLGFSGLGIGDLPGNLDFEAGWYDRASGRNSDEFEHLRTLSGERIDDAFTAGVTYDLRMLRLIYAMGESRDFIKSSLYRAELKMPLAKHTAMVLDSMLYRAEANGDGWERDWQAGAAAFDDRAEMANVNLGFAYKNVMVGFSYVGTEAELSNGQVGYGYFEVADNLSYRSDAWTLAGNDFNNDGEDAYQVALRVKLDGLRIGSVPLDGWTVLVLKKWGRFDAPNPFAGGRSEEVKEYHTGFNIGYRFDEPNRKGFSTGIQYLDYDVSEDFFVAVSARPNQAIDAKEVRVYLDYAF